MAKLKVKVNTKDLLNGKFSNTIATINGYVKEAEGDCATYITYGAPAVSRRMNDIQRAFEKDLANLAKEIEIDE